MTDKKNETVTVHSEPFRAWLLRNTADSRAPYSQYAQRPEAFQYSWKMLQNVFHIPDPKSFPKANYAAEEIELLYQFVQTCRDLASMTVLSFEGGISFSTGVSGQGQVERNLPPADTLRGALVTLRQLEKPDEDGSFLKVWRCVGRRLNEVDAIAARRHNRYRLIQNKLMNGYLIKMADVLACSKQGFDTELAMSLHHFGKPIDVINEAMYTGHVHWNRKRVAAGAMEQAKDDVSAGMFEMDVYDSLIQLSHWKFVYAQFLEQQLDPVA
jgi:hypothetical protein